MGKSITFTMIKPPAVNDQNFGSILSMIKEAGFRVTSLKMIQLTNNSASAFTKSAAKTYLRSSSSCCTTA